MNICKPVFKTSLVLYVPSFLSLCRVQITWLHMAVLVKNQKVKDQE